MQLTPVQKLAYEIVYSKEIPVTALEYLNNSGFTFRTKNDLQVMIFSDGPNFTIKVLERDNKNSVNVANEIKLKKLNLSILKKIIENALALLTIRRLEKL